MKELINDLLSELSLAVVRESSKLSIPCSLFSDESTPPIEFNGFICPFDYHTYCDNLFDVFRKRYEDLDLSPDEKLLLLQELKFIIEDQLKGLFPEDDLHFIFLRIKPQKIKTLHNYSSEKLKERTLLFLNIQQRMLVRLSKYFSNQIYKLRNKPIITRDPLSPLFQESYDQDQIKAVSFDKLRVFNKNTGTTHWTFNGSKVDMEVLVHLLQAGQVFIYPNGKSATKPELREVLSFIGNFKPAKNPGSTLNRVKERAEKSEYIFTRLSTAYQDFMEDVYKPKSKNKGV
jgi:hypothetical protein